ncbi:sensor domain-containing diguanylate cyclase [Pseudomonas stutzeri]|nr:sensor domain-containing diguanylate cyclase [Stutzerimonas stutzeri]
MPQESSRPAARAARSSARRPGPVAALVLLIVLFALAPPAHPGSEAAILYLDGSERALDLYPYFGLQRGAVPGSAAPPDDAAFRAQRERADLNLGYTADGAWLRLELQSRAERPAEWRIAFSYPPLDHVELFAPGPAGIERQSAGDSLPRAQRSLDHRAPLFAVRLAPGERRTLYFHAHSSGSLSLDARLWSAAAFASDDRRALLLLALYFGILLGLAAYNLLLFLALRERSFLLYVLFAAAAGLAMLAFSGLGAQYLWPQGGAWGTRALPFCLGLANAGAILFSRSLLDSARHVPFWHRLLTIDLAAQLLVGLATLLLPGPLMLQVLARASLANLLLLLGAGLACARRGVPAARSFVAAIGMLLAGSLLLTLRNFGLLPSNSLTLNALLIGSALELLLLSFALAQRLNALRQQHLDAQQQDLQALQEQERLLEQRVAERTAALAVANRRLRELALKDPLTGLANRTALRQHLEQAWQRARRRGEMLAVLLVDLDEFKPVNDSHGHEAGDLLLAQVARRLEAGARATDLVARLGGDEFVLVCEGIGSEEQAEQLAGRLLEDLGEPFRLGAEEVRIGASIGISFGRGCQNSADLLREADQAMYRAKAAGRNRLCLGRRHGDDAARPLPPDEA